MHEFTFPSRKQTAKDRLRAVVDAQPDDATYDQILREDVFERMVDRGLRDSREGRFISKEDMGKRIRSWRS